MLVVAHAGHFVWILYTVPIIVVGISIAMSVRRERREAKDGEADAGD